MSMRPGMARPSIVQRQSPTLAMTPRMQQAVRLLQFTGPELEAFLAEAAERNPLLRVADGGGERDAAPAAEATERVGTDALLARRDARGSGTDRPLDTDYANVYAGDGARRGEGRFDDDEMPGPDQTIPDLPTLTDHLAEQASLAFTDPRDRLLADHLIGAVDGAGWLAEPPEAIAERLGCAPARLEQVLAACRGFDPPGVFARGLADCLALQLAERDRLDPAMRCMLAHLDLVARRDVAALSRLCGVDIEDVVDMVAEIRRLDPKPGAHFAVEPAPTRIPEVLIRPAPLDPDLPGAAPGWIVELNDAALPRLLIDRRYRAEVSAGAPPGSTARVYLRRCLDDARWLIRALDRRATTLLAVATAITQRQDAFLREGITHLRPMVLREIATDTGLHESTVSRVVSGKTIEAPRGLFAMKSLFTQGLAAAAAGAVVTSAEAVRHRIRAMIEAEDEAAPLSDDRVAALLKQEGIAIARRTVAKYREAMGIPGSGQRRLDAVMMPARLARA